MKNIVLLIAVIFGIWIGVDAQNKNGKTPPVNSPTSTQEVKNGQAEPAKPITNILGDHYVKKYAIASRWSDYDVAKDALYDLITEYSGNDSLIFALALFYYENQKYPSCALVCKDLLARNPKNPSALELSGISYENLNIKDRALQNFESLFLLTNNNSTLYKMAALQFELKRYQEAMTNADILLTKPEVETMKVVFNDTETKTKEYALKAALFNLKGMVFKAQADNVSAKKFFEEALKVEPEFPAAKLNLAALK